MRLRRMFAIGMAGALLLACKGDKGDKGDPGDPGATGQQGPAGTPGTTTFGGITDVPPALVLPFPGGASAAIVTSVTVTASADCGSVAPAPKLQVYIDGQFLNETDVTQSTFADTSPFAVNPARYVHEIAVGFPNDNNNGSCDHNLHVQQIKLTTAAGVVTIPATDAAHVIYDRGGYFDNVDVQPATTDLVSNGALRFFLSQPSTVQGKVTNALGTAGGLSRTGNFTTSGGTIIIFAHASAFSGTAGSTIRVDVTVDGTIRTSMSGFTNEAGSHKALPGTAFVLTGLAPGPHTVGLQLGAGSADANDYSQVTILELPI